MKTFMTTIRTSVTHSFGIDKDARDMLTGTRPLARAYCYPGNDWFSMTLGSNKEDVHITWPEWEKIVQHVASLKSNAELEVTLKRKEAQEGTGGAS